MVLYNVLYIIKIMEDKLSFQNSVFTFGENCQWMVNNKYEKNLFWGVSVFSKAGVITCSVTLTPSR